MKTTQVAPPNQPRHARLKLLLIIALFLAPLLLAFLWHYAPTLTGATLLPQTQSNHAILLTPAVPLADFSNARHASTTSRAPLTRADWTKNGQKREQKKWRIIHIIDTPCRTPCRTALYHSRQIRQALGKDRHRLERWFIVKNPTLAAQLAREHPQAVFLQPGNNGLEQQLAMLATTTVQNADAWLVDPLGNVLMMIPRHLAPRLVLKDLKKLLKLSHIG